MKEYFNKKEFYLQLSAVILFLLVSCLSLFLFQKKETINLLDSQEYLVETFSDVWDQGHSVSEFISKNKDGMTFKCRLEKGMRYPYAGIQIRKADSTFFSLKDYKLEMQILTKEKQRMGVRIYNFKEGISDSITRNSFALYNDIYIVDKGENLLEIPFNNFTTIPEWWYTNNNVIESDFPSWDKDSVGYISIFSDPGFILGEDRVFKVTKFLLVGDYSDVYLLIVIFVTTILLLFFGIHSIVYLKQKKIQLIIKYSDDSDLQTKDADLKSKIHAFVSENYSNSELKSTDLANHLNIPEYKIGEILKDTLGMTFKSFLNHTRIEAAKIYLKNSSYSISEIAYKTGFNSPSSFNRVFKEIVNQSPGEFKN